MMRQRLTHSMRRIPVCLLGICVIMILGWTAANLVPVMASPTDDHLVMPVLRQELSTIAAQANDVLERALPSLSREQLARRRVAQTTFCLPQNVVGAAYYTLLRLIGKVTHTATRHEIVLVVTRTPFGASLGRFLFVGEAFLTETAVRHEYGHTLQGYRRGPFYLLFEGVTSFVQAALSMAFPSFAAGYYDRWPENEADVLGGVHVSQ